MTDLNSTYCEVTWDPIPSEHINAATLLGYEVFWEKGTNSTINVTRTAQTTVWLTDLEEDTEYSVTISAFNRIGSGPNSSLFTFRTDKGPRAPSAPPTNLRVTNLSSTYSEVTWDPIPSQHINAATLLGYEVFWVKVLNSTVNVTRTAQTAVWLTDLEEDTEYNVTISAFNRMGSGPNSSLFTFRTEKGPRAPSAPPTNLRVTNLGSTFSEVTWDPISSQYINAATLIGYEVFWVKVLDSTVNVTRTAQTTVWLTDLEEDTEYNVTISAFNQMGSGPNSSLFTFRTDKGPRAPSAPPTNLRVTNLGSTYSEVTWDPIPSQHINAATPLGYEVFWEKVSNPIVNVTRTAQTTVWLTDLEEDTDYNVIINAFNQIGGGPNSSLFTFRTEKGQ